jgi:hypothetical protein
MDDDYYNPTKINDIDITENQLDLMKKTDKGYNKVLRSYVSPNGATKQKKIEFYTSNGTGCRIRDAETGDYYKHIVGTPDEDLYFKIAMSTGECKSRNGSNTLFYTSPQQFVSHFNITLDKSDIEKWENKYKTRMQKLNIMKKQKQSLSLVN